jgi:ABC-type nitrate/sulfonate/bicarbonate transport system permease component
MRNKHHWRFCLMFLIFNGCIWRRGRKWYLFPFILCVIQMMHPNICMILKGETHVHYVVSLFHSMASFFLVVTIHTILGVTMCGSKWIVITKNVHVEALYTQTSTRTNATPSPKLGPRWPQLQECGSLRTWGYAPSFQH